MISTIGYNTPSYNYGNTNDYSRGVRLTQGVPTNPADPNQIPTNNPNQNPSDPNQIPTNNPNQNPSDPNQIPTNNPNQNPSDPTNPAGPNYNIPSSVRFDVNLSYERTTRINHIENSRETKTVVNGTATLNSDSGTLSAKYKDTTEESGEIEKMPKNTAIGRQDGNTCKLTVKRSDGIVQKFEAPKQKDSSCIVNPGGKVMTLTDENSIYDSEDGTFTVTQTGVSIEYKQISKKK